VRDSKFLPLPKPLIVPISPSSVYELTDVPTNFRATIPNPTLLVKLLPSLTDSALAQDANRIFRRHDCSLADSAEIVRKQRDVMRVIASMDAHPFVVARFGPRLIGLAERINPAFPGEASHPLETDVPHAGTGQESGATTEGHRQGTGLDRARPDGLNGEAGTDAGIYGVQGAPVSVDAPAAVGIDANA
jgi:hypothetical protein